MFTQSIVAPWNTWNVNGYSQLTGLSNVQLQNLEVAYNQAALNGPLSFDQFSNLHSNVYGSPLNYSPNAQQAFLALNGGSGVSSFNQFLLSHLLLHPNVSPVQRWTYAFNAYPLAQPGYVSFQEAEALYNNVHQFYGLPAGNSYFSTAWNQLNVGPTGVVPVSQFVDAVVPLIPQQYIL